MSKAPKGVADHPARSQMEALWRAGSRAKAIAQFLSEEGFPLISESTIARYGQRFWSEKTTINTEDIDLEEISTLVSDIENSNLGKVTKIGMTKKSMPTGIHSYQSIEIVPQSDELPVQKANIAPVKINWSKKDYLKPRPEGFKLCVVIPDMQIGYYRDPDGDLFPTQDEDAIDVVHQIQQILQAQYGIDLVVLVGDNLDFASLSTHRTAPGYTQTTQLEIDRYGTEMAVQRSICKDAQIISLIGNHEDRLNKLVVDKAPALSGISRANERSPLLSIANLCRFDEYRIEAIESYPDGEFWANNYLRFEHGSHASSAAGATANKLLSKYNASTVYGHIHRQEILYSKVMERTGPRTIFAGSPGCLAKIDGILPSASTGITPAGTQAAQKGERWHQGMWVIWYEEDGLERAFLDPILIEDGSAIFQGTVIQSRTPIGVEYD